jgi:SAM-dependent methyltransferase
VKKQLAISQIGEVRFRKKLFQQQVEGKQIFNDEFDAEGIKKILKDRMEKTFNQMNSLKKTGVLKSPYLEIGAERCQRSLVMENDIGATGVAIDISYDMLKSCNYYMNLFNKCKMPLRICCDAYNLPFMKGSFPFVFCYETLHHFPDPTPIVKEIHKVLSPGGYFFFDDEPYKQILHFNLYKSNKVYSERSLRSGKVKKMMDSFFSERSCNEIEYGIIENYDITVGHWKKALDFFENKQVRLRSLKGINSELFWPKHYIKFFLSYLLGGVISGTCQKSGDSIIKNSPISEILICPFCNEKGYESNLSKGNLSFLCSKCGNKFPIVDNVIFLFSPNKFRKLYSDIFEKLAHKK